MQLAEIKTEIVPAGTEAADNVLLELGIDRLAGLVPTDAAGLRAHVVSDRRLGEPRTNRELFLLLARGGVLPEDLAERLGAMAGFRNVLVHGYGDVDLGVVEDVVTNRTGDLLEFVRGIRGRGVSR